MVNSREVPSRFTLQWDAGFHQKSRARNSNILGLSTASATDRIPQRKFRSSCEICRRARVKCSGGHPCQRCAQQGDVPLCTYGVSQRHGKRKASSIGNSQGGSPAQSYSSEQSTTTAPSSTASLERHPWVDSQSDFAEMFTLAGGSGASHNFTPNVDAAIAGNPTGLMLSDDFDLDALPFPEPPSNPYQLDFGANLVFSDEQSTTCKCRQSNQELFDYIDLAIREPEKVSIDRVLQSLQDIPGHISAYLACSQCFRDCPRIIDFAMLHQRQVNLLCAMAKAPNKYLKGVSMFTLGSFQLSGKEDLEHKRLVILSAARSADSLMDDFSAMVKDKVFNTTKMSEATRLNYRWLMDINRHLKSRLKVILSILEKPEWVLAVEEP